MSDKRKPGVDPMEKIVADALDDAGIPHLAGDANPSRLDFHLIGLGIDIEVKRFHAPRIAEQMGRVDNVIAVQGEKAVRLLAEAIKALGAQTRSDEAKGEEA